jgi:hypothetical protein
MRKLLFFNVLLTVFLFSCSKSYKSEPISANTESLDLEEEMIPITRQVGAGSQEQKAEPNYIYDKKIIKDARIGLEVKEYSNYKQDLDSLVYAVNGYISSENLDKDNYSIKCDLTIRIPSQNFEQLISFLEKGSEKLLYKNVSARDITEEYIDLETRLQTKKEVEKRYIQLLSRAKNIEEILQVEEKIRRLREEIESKEGRLKYLKNQVAYSSIYVSIVQNMDYKYEPVKEMSFRQRLFKSIDKGWKGFIVFLLMLFRIWPLIIVGLGVFYYIRRVNRNKKKNINSN